MRAYILMLMTFKALTTFHSTNRFNKILICDDSVTPIKRNEKQKHFLAEQMSRRSKQKFIGRCIVPLKLINLYRKTHFTRNAKYSQINNCMTFGPRQAIILRNVLANDCLDAMQLLQWNESERLACVSCSSRSSVIYDGAHTTIDNKSVNAWSLTSDANIFFFLFCFRCCPDKFTKQ